MCESNKLDNSPHSVCSNYVSWKSSLHSDHPALVHSSACLDRKGAERSHKEEVGGEQSPQHHEETQSDFCRAVTQIPLTAAQISSHSSHLKGWPWGRTKTSGCTSFLNYLNAISGSCEYKIETERSFTFVLRDLCHIYLFSSFALSSHPEAYLQILSKDVELTFWFKSINHRKIMC